VVLIVDKPALVVSSIDDGHSLKKRGGCYRLRAGVNVGSAGPQRRAVRQFFKRLTEAA